MTERNAHRSNHDLILYDPKVVSLNLIFLLMTNIWQEVKRQKVTRQNPWGVTVRDDVLATMNPEFLEQVNCLMLSFLRAFLILFAQGK